MSESNTRITDSVWYWVYLFCTAGLIALVLMGPRFSSRQAQIERKYQARQRAAQQMVGEQPRTALSSVESTTITLWPLYLVLGLLFSIAWINLIRRHLRGRRGAETAP